ncbi:3-deoxy-D-manno-octulosonic-acid transferase KdtA [Helicobacter sp. NHP19-012]|uniref:3-deoxy-D-manno-octulosonic acid transferase n=1 Tax=Helicobacter gastrofelis TaxID=2849642 RepID=A0ABM7SFY2_9HELI|nr:MULTISPECIES: lipid IV(A) 3-deoxy-D-manno-octulosonic acid transferase [unclassified Helicobacter]BCZ18525.1 3-deoxy-D-manno-octulosonic-acid transferase KdtA [Helicobacter sp. NHP19-012]GMB95799.1 3-deoxy-D-manno-octulosonic-acid transferase KdtA [Helicobacter sp. NHP22-001]
MAFFKFVYLTLLSVGHLCATPFLALFSLKAKYRHSLKARFFARRYALSFKPRLWLHACSLGEVKSLECLLNAFKDTPTLLTTTTQTGYNHAQKLAKDHHNLQAHFLLFETLLFLWCKDLDELKALVVTEAELWFQLFAVAKSVGAKTFLINARISSRSYPKYKRFKPFYTALFKNIDFIYAQSVLDKERLESLGAKTLCVFPHTKLFNPPICTKNYPKLKNLSIVGASTHASEEALIVEAFLSLDESAQLILVPRHPERFKEVRSYLEKHPKLKGDFSCFSRGLRWDSRVLLIDALGELINFYAIADIVILGGAFAPIGGHNPLEPAYFGVKLISGTHIFNQEALFACVQNFYLVQENELAPTLANHATLKHSKIDTHEQELQTLIKAINVTGV